MIVRHNRSLLPPAAIIGCLFIGSTGARAQPAPAPAPQPAAPEAPLTPEPPPEPSDAPTRSGVDDRRYTPSEYVSRPAELPEHLRLNGAWRLALSQVIELAIRKNLALEVKRLSLRAGRYRARSERGAFEPFVAASYSHREEDVPPVTAQEGAAEDIVRSIDNDWSATLGQRFRTGTVVQLDFNNGWSQSSAATAVRPDLFRSTLELSVRQPLLKGFSVDTDIASAEILRAEFDSEGALEDARVAAAATVSDAERGYWDLVQALKTYQIRQASLELAERQLQLTESQINAGLLPPSDRIAAEGTLARRELDLVRAEQDIEGRSDELRRLMNVSPERYRRPIVPVDTPAFAEAAVDVPALIARANGQRPELRKSDVDLERAHFEQRVADNNRLPQLDVRVGYGLIGQDEDYDQALRNMSAFRGRYWTAGVNLTWTPLGLEAGSEQDRRQTLRQQVEVQRKQVLENIRIEVRQAAREVTTAARQVRAAARSRSLSERSLDAEQRKFLNGTSSNFVIAQRQEELAQAHLAELTAVIAHAKALVALNLATGDLLASRNVQLVLAPSKGR
jgi:outer membrane protein TolC